MNPTHLQCVVCGKHFPALPGATTCPLCVADANRPAILDLVYSEDMYDAAASIECLRSPRTAAGIWAFDHFLPVTPGTSRLTLGEGHTPTIAVPALAAALGLRSLHIKNECQSPTGSLKDRIAPIVVAKALEAGAKVMVVISSGNMANAVTAFGAANGLKTVAIVSPSTRPARIRQISILGGLVLRVQGSSADRIDLCNKAAAHFGWYNATSPYNPYGSHGAKTIAFELFARGETFDWIVFPVGFGCNIVGVLKGFLDLQRLGCIRDLPRFAAVQPEGSPSLVRAFERGLEEAVPGPQETIAGGISQVATPNSRLALKALYATEGTAVAVSDEELIQSVLLLARNTGIFAEPAGAAGLAGLRRLVQAGKIGANERVLFLVTGSGTKDPPPADRMHLIDIPEIEPSLESIERTLPPELVRERHT